MFEPGESVVRGTRDRFALERREGISCSRNGRKVFRMGVGYSVSQESVVRVVGNQNKAGKLRK